MEWIAVILIGLILGNGVRWLAEQLPPDANGTRQPLHRPTCAACGRPHAPLEWWGTLALVVRRGRCAQCHAPRDLSRVWVEWLTLAAVAGGWVWAAGDWSRFIATAFLMAAFVLITAIDVEHRLVLWIVVWPSALIAIWAGLAAGRDLTRTLIGGAVGYGLVFGLFLLAEGYSWLVARWQGRPLDEVAFGGGDVNLAGIMGLATGWPAILLVLLITIFAGGFFSLGYIVVQVIRRKYTPHTAIAFGPFFIFGGVVLYFFAANIGAYFSR